MARIRVRMLYTKYPHWGGQAGFTQLIRYLDPSRIGVHAHGASDNDDDLPLPNDRLRSWLRQRVQRSGMAWYKLSDLAAELRTLPSCLANVTNVVHFLDAEHSAQYLPAWIRRARISRTRTVATYHQPPDLLDGLVNKELIRRIDHVTLVSPAQLPYFQAFLPPERVSVILHGVNCDFFRPDPTARSPGRFKCITAGHWLRDWTAVGAVASKLADLEDVEFHVVTSHATGLEAMPNVTIHRQVDDLTFRALYCAADVLFLPLTGSTANNALLEGMASGLPVVSTRLPSIEAYAPGEEATLIDGNVVDGLVDALLRLRGDLDLRQRMGHAARGRAEALSWTNVAPRYSQLYSSLISVSRNGKPMSTSIPSNPRAKNLAGAWSADPDLQSLNSWGRVQSVYQSPSLTGPEDRLLLFGLVSGRGPARALEIGFRYGGTSLIILCALEDRGTPGRLVSIDPAPEPAVDLAPFAHRFHLLRASSPAAIPEAVQLLGGPIEFCFIDGDHRYAGVTADLEGVTPEMSHDGYILLHDALWPDVRRGIADFVAAHPKRIIDCGPIAPWANAEGWGGMHLLRTVGEPNPRGRGKAAGDGPR